MSHVSEWEASYQRRENHTFVPSDELVRFVSRHLRRRIGLDEIVDVAPGALGARTLDLGCGIGRSLVYGTQMGLEMHGIDLSTVAVQTAIEWLSQLVGDIACERVIAGDAASLPWDDDAFAHAVSDSALDSMPFATALQAMVELRRVVRGGGLVYVNLIASKGESSEAVVSTTHEHGTIQSYFDRAKIDELCAGFELLQLQLTRIDDLVSGTGHGRWHIVMRNP